MWALRDPQRRELERLERLECFVSKQWFVTVHDSSLDESFRERAAGPDGSGRCTAAH